VASGADLAVLPVGAIEQHGPHLPLATDWLIADGLGREIGRRLEAYVLPAIPFSVSEVHRGFRGSVTLR
jgi:creatinine amidohydrolase